MFSLSSLILQNVEIAPAQRCFEMETFKISVDELLEKTKQSPPTQFTKPKEIGFYSIDEKRNVTLDKSQLVSHSNCVPVLSF